MVDVVPEEIPLPIVETPLVSTLACPVVPPPPYPETPYGTCAVCGLQNPNGRETCAQSGAHRPNVETTTPRPIYPVLTPQGTYYIPPLPPGHQQSTQVAAPTFPGIETRGHVYQTPIEDGLGRALNRVPHPTPQVQVPDNTLGGETPTAASPSPTRAPMNPPPAWDFSDSESMPDETVLQPFHPTFSAVVPMPEGQSILITVGQGDLLAQSVGIIVNPANGTLSHQGGLALQMARAAGPKFTADSLAYVRTHGPIDTGNIAVTIAGRLPCQYVIHAVGPHYSSTRPQDSAMLLTSVVQRSIMYASNLSEEILPDRTIAFPAISAGIFGYPPSQCAEVTMGAIANLVYDKFIKLYELRFVLDNSLMLHHYVQAAKTAFTHQSAPHPPPVQLEGSWPNPPPPPPAPTPPLLPSEPISTLPPPPADPQPTPQVPVAPVSPHGPHHLYIKFTPNQSNTLTRSLPDPESSPMPFYRAVLQIHQNYSATWQDLIGLCPFPWLLQRFCGF